MEECIICFEPTDNFFIFTCAHKTCYECAQKIIINTNKCPICEYNILQYDKPYIIIPIQQGILDTSQNTREVHISCFKIYCIFFVFAFIIFYIINYTL